MADRNTFLKLMSMLESSGGKNTAHRPMEEGMHKGQSAMGEYGIMPNTAKEIASRRVQVGDATELDKMIAEADPNSIKDILAQNPEKYQEYTEQLADRVLDTAQGDPATAASGWLYGHNMSKDRMNQALQNDPEYKQRIERAIAEQGLSSQQPNFLDSLTTDAREQLFSSDVKPKTPARDPNQGPQLRQGTGTEKPMPSEFGGQFDYRQLDEINKAVEDAAGFVGGGIGKIGPKALNAAQALMVTPASKFGRVMRVGEDAAPGLGKVKRIPEKTLEALKGAAPKAEEEAKLSIEELRRRALEAAQARKGK